MRIPLLTSNLVWVLVAQASPLPAGDPRLDAQVVEAAIKGDLPLLEAALAGGGNPNAMHPKGESAFHLAVLCDRVQAAERLLAARATGLNELRDLTGKGKPKVRPLSWAAWGRQEAMVRMLLKRGADAKALDEDGRDALAGAVVTEGAGIVEALLVAGVDPNRRWPAGHSAVWLAALRGKPAILQILLDHKGNVDSREDHGGTPLMAAAQMGHVETVRLLLDRGAPVYPLDAWEGSALSYARKAKDPAAVRQISELLTKADAQEGNPLRTLDSAFLHAVADGNLEKAKSLLAKGADLHARGKFDGDSFLPDALSLSQRHPDIFTFLLGAGINPHMRSSYDFTALHQAAREGTPEMIERLVVAGLDVNAKSKSAMVPLYMAINGRTMPRNVATLLKLGADPNATTPSRSTLLDFARERGKADVVQMLVAAGAKGSPEAAAPHKPQMDPAPKAAAAARPTPAPASLIDGFELAGLRLGMEEREVLAAYGTASFQAKGGLRVASLPLAAEQVPFLSGASDLTMELTLVEQKLARIIIQFVPATHVAAEAALLERLQGPSADQERKFTRGSEKLVRRDLAWLGSAHYVDYRRFARIGGRHASLMLSVLPRQVNRPAYDVVSVNKPDGADFYVAQNGAFVKSSRVGGKVVFHLKRAPFQIGGGREAMRVALAEHPIGEFTLDLDPAAEDRYSSLSGTHCGAVAEHMDYLLVNDGRLGCESISCLSTEFCRTVKPMPGYKVAYEFGSLARVDGDTIPVAAAPAVLHGFLVLTTDRTREDGSHLTLTTPIELVFQ